MGEIFNLWDSFFKELPKIKGGIEAAALKNRLDVDSALFLIAVCCYPNIKISAEQKIIEELCNKGLCEYNEKGITATSRGTILAKSLTITLKKIWLLIKLVIFVNKI